MSRFIVSYYGALDVAILKGKHTTLDKIPGHNKGLD